MLPFLFEIPGPNGPIPICSFGLVVFLGFCAGIWPARRLARRVAADPDDVVLTGVVCLISGVVGCRLLNVVSDWPRYSAAFAEGGWTGGLGEILNVSTGGMDWFGGFLLATACGLLACRKFGLPMWDVLDIGMVWAALSHGLGRIGCFLSGCCFGTVCNGFPGVSFPRAELGGATVAGGAYGEHLRRGWIGPDDAWSLPVHPTQLYELIGELMIFTFLLGRFGRRRYAGELLPLYFMLQGGLRFGVEFWRGDNPRDFFGALSLHHLIALGLVIVGAGLAVAGRVWRPPAPAAASAKAEG